jgi:hypothetical protein
MKQIAKIFAVCLTLWCIFSVNKDGLTASALTLPNSSTTGAKVTISVSIGEPVLKLWGYGAPDSRIEISGERVTDFTYSGSDGYFEFPKAYLPTPTGLFYPELCLTEIDQVDRSTPPTCIPALPADKFSYDIGPVILPPTLSLEAGAVIPSSQSGASGITIPNSEVKIVLAEDSHGQSLADFSIVKTAKAYYIPNYTIKSDSRGYFSFNMPDTSPNTWRIFAVTNYSQGESSPKSNTLKFEVLSPIMAAMENIWALILSLLTLPTLIILEIVVIMLITAAVFLNKRGKRKLSPSAADPVRQYQIYLKSKRII